MKIHIATVITLMSLISPTSFAGFTTDGQWGSLNCIGTGISVQINAARSKFVLRENGQDLKYIITVTQSNNDTEVDYTAQLNSAHSTDAIELSFDDETGDTLMLHGKSIDLQCTPNSPL